MEYRTSSATNRSCDDHRPTCSPTGHAHSVPFFVSQANVLVDEHDPAVQNPTKYIGQFYSETDARQLAERDGQRIRSQVDGLRQIEPQRDIPGCDAAFLAPNQPDAALGITQNVLG